MKRPEIEKHAVGVMPQDAAITHRDVQILPAVQAAARSLGNVARTMTELERQESSVDLHHELANRGELDHARKQLQILEVAAATVKSMIAEVEGGLAPKAVPQPPPQPEVQPFVSDAVTDSPHDEDMGGTATQTAEPFSEFPSTEEDLADEPDGAKKRRRR